MKSTLVSLNYVFLCSVLRLLVTAILAPTSQILVTQMMMAIRSSETSVLPRATQCNIQEYGALQLKLN
jgi:hypothetical protein